MLFEFGLIVLIPFSLEYNYIHLQAGLLYLLSVPPPPPLFLRVCLPVFCQPPCPLAYMYPLVELPTTYLLAYLLLFLLRLASFLYVNLFLSDLKLYFICFF